MNYILLLCFIMPVQLTAMCHDYPNHALAQSEPRFLTPFDLFNPEHDKSFFDNEVESWFSNIANNIVEEVTIPVSSYEQLWIDCSQTTLNEIVRDPNIAQHIIPYWNAMQEDIHQAYTQAFESAARHTSLKDRAKLFTAFRKVGAQTIHTLMSQHVSPEITSPDKEPAETFLQRLLEANKRITFDQSQMEKCKALTLLQYTFRQIHRMLDVESDNPNLFISPQITEKKEG